MALPEPLEPVFVGGPLPAALNEERTAINELTGELQNKISHPSGAATGDLLRWDGTQWVTTETRLFEGNGRPDGQVAAPVGSRYIDKTALQGAVEYVKIAGGDSSTGWQVQGGDTGRRNIASLVSPLPAGAVVNAAYVQRIGQVVEMYLDLTMPTAVKDTWQVIASIPGFGPSYDRRAALQDNRETANTGGTMVESDGGVILYNTVPGKRDRYAGTWLTDKAWPASLPGAAT